MTKQVIRNVLILFCLFAITGQKAMANAPENGFVVTPQDIYLCEGHGGDTIRFLAASNFPEAVFVWEFADKENPSDWNPIVPNNENGMRADLSVLTVWDDAIEAYRFRCRIKDNFTGGLIADNVEFQAQIVPPPSAGFHFSLPDQEGAPIDDHCINHYIQLNDESSASGLHGDNEIAQWEWRINGALTSIMQSTKHLFTEAGGQEVTLTVTDAYGCSHDSTRVFVALDQVTPEINGRATVCNNQVVEYELELGNHDHAEDDLSYHWHFAMPSGSSLEDYVADTLSAGNTIKVWWQDNDMNQPDIPQVSLEVEIYSNANQCFIGHASKEIVYTGKKSPNVPVIIQKQPEGNAPLPGHRLLVAFMDEDDDNYKFPDDYDFSWGVNDEEMDPQNSEHQHFYLFEYLEEENTYWFDIKYRDHEACYNRAVFQPNEND